MEVFQDLPLYNQQPKFIGNKVIEMGETVKKTSAVSEVKEILDSNSDTINEYLTKKKRELRAA